jgi:DNA helicase HerA-like ATPase
VGVFFVTQNPTDVPDTVLGQLGNRVQHALRVFTAKDRRDLRRAAETYRPNPAFSTEEAIMQVGTGEAVTSVLEGKGVPGVVERTLIRPPVSRLGVITAEERAAAMAASGLGPKYDRGLDRDSAHEMLARRAQAAAEEAGVGEEDGREFSAARRYRPGTAAPPKRTGRTDSPTDAFAKSFARQLGTQAGRALVRGVLGGLFRAR